MRVLACFDGRFGQIRVLERKSDSARLYCINSSVQTMVQPDGVSLFGYVHATKLLLRSAHRILIVGGGGGSLATMLSRAGHDVTVLDVDPAAEEVARAYFDLDARVRWITCDVGSFCQTNDAVFDAICIDACDAEGLVSDFADAERLAALLLALACPDGSLVLNLVHRDGAPPWGEALAKAIAARGLNATLYRSEEGWEGNELLHIRAEGPTDELIISDVQRRPPDARTYLLSLRAHTPSRALIPDGSTRPGDRRAS